MASRDPVSHLAPARMHQESQEPQDAISIFRDVYLIVNQKALLQSLQSRKFCSKKFLCSVSVTPLNLGEAHPLMKIDFAFHCCCSVAQSCLTLCDPIAARQASLSFTISLRLFKLMSIESMMPSNHLVLSHPLLIITSIYLRFKVFSNESALPIRRPKYWSFSFSISSANEYSGLISFRMDWLDLLADQGTLKSLLQHHISKADQLFSTQVYL